MILVRDQIKKNISVILIFVLIIYFSSFMIIDIYAEDDRGFGVNKIVNGWGYWDDHQAGLRFSLVDKDCNTIKSVDVFDFNSDVGTKHSITNSNDGVHGTIGDILSNKIKTYNDGWNKNNFVLNDAEFRIFNKCKFDVVRDSNEELIKYEKNMVLVHLSDFEEFEKKRSNPGVTWYCADVRTVFKNTVLKNFDKEYFLEFYNSKKISDYPVINEVWAKTDAVDEFICDHITGKSRKTIKSFQPDDKAWIGMCDLLYALGLDVYNNVNQEQWDDKKNISKLYNNLVNEFVIPGYCVVVEPIMFFGIALFENQGTYNKPVWVRVKTVIYYGSMTELGILESIGWAEESDRQYYSKKSEYDPSKPSKPIQFDILHESVVTRFVGQQCAYITDEFKYDLKKCGAEDFLSVVDTKYFMNEWKLCRFSYPDVKYEFNAYNENIIKNYATAISVITSSDFIKPQVETYDTEYRTDTNVVSSLKVSNRSDDNYTTSLNLTDVTSNTAVNKNNVPKAMLCRFTVEKVSDASGEIKRYAYNGTISTHYLNKLEELGFAKGEDGKPLTEFYGSLDGITPRKESDANKPCYVSFDWKTPKKPCRVTFKVEFQNANCGVEAVLGTDAHDGLRATEIKSDDGKYTTEFYCDIVKGANSTLFTEDTVPPDSVAIISVAPNAAAGTEEQKLYDLNRSIYDTYYSLHGKNAAVYTGTDFVGKTMIESQSWSEYVADYGAGSSIVLTHKPHTVSIGISKTTDDSFTESTSKILRTDQNGLYSDYADTIGSGYGIGVDFVASFNEDSAGIDYIRDVNVNGATYHNNLVTNYDHGAVMFPEYNYKKYYGELLKFDSDTDLAGRSAERRFLLTANKDSKFYGDAVVRPVGMSDEEYADYDEMNRNEKSRVHFTPVWYPDGKYQIVVCMFDAWTPAGQLWFYKTYDIEIKGSIYDTWYVTRTYKNQITS